MEFIRNVCILAHVDHGKTSLADNLLCSNGIISQYSAGDLRHLDSTQDEQERGITMKSSCISLKHNYCNKLKDKNEYKNYIINLIDSPGHVDFSGEVSTAVKISDNAFIIVDVIEGVSSQTRTVIQQAWKERLNFVLVLNKIDKMFIELKMDTTVAYRKLEEIIQAVHHIIGELISLDNREEEEKTDSILLSEHISRNYDTNPFNPLKGKVIFCSAYHQWGFRLSDFIPIYSRLLGIDKLDLFKKMWGDYYINSKKQICKGAIANDRKNMFTNLILDQIWNVYRALELKEIDKVCQMMKKLEITVELKNKDSSYLENIRNVFRKWLPLSVTCFDTLVEKCPNPKESISDKKLSLLVPNEMFKSARNIIKEASTDRESPVVVFISKFMFQSHQNTDLIGLGRIYSGQVRSDMKMFAFAPRFNPYKVSQSFLACTPDDFEEGPINVYVEDDSNNNQKSCDIYVTRLKNVYQFSGQDTILLKNGAPAGFIVGFTGLDSQQAYKNLALVAKCRLEECLGVFSQCDVLMEENCNIICVSVEPKKVTYLNELQDAMRLLEKADPIVNVSLSPTGELLLYAAGEIHLQKCLNELTNRIAPHIELDVSAPIVPFRETVIHLSCCDLSIFDSVKSLSEELKQLRTNNIIKSELIDSKQPGLKESIIVYIRLPQKTGTQLCCRISIHSLPHSLVEWIEKNSVVLSLLNNAIKTRNELSQLNIDQKNHLLNSLKIALENATKEEVETCENTDIIPIDYLSMMDQLWAIGNTQTTQCNMLFSFIGAAGLFSSNSNVDVNNTQQFGPFAHSIMKGFQRALKSGPICQEMIKNTAFIVHNIWESTYDLMFDSNENISTINDDADCEKMFDFNTISSLTCNPGQMSLAVTKACQTALLNHPGARLMIAMYKVDLEVRINTYKHLSSIINQLHGQVVKQEVNFGNFIVEARMPVIESFGFSDKLLKKTSGEVGLPQLKTILWEILNCPPMLDMNLYKKIVDRAEQCDIGIPPELVTRTQKYINNIRTRKGIQVRQQLVESGDKQRTLNKKK